MSMRPWKQREVARGQQARFRLAVDFQQAVSPGHDVERRTPLGPHAHSPGRAELGAEVERPGESDLFQNVREYVKHDRSERMDMKLGRLSIETAACRNDTAPERAGSRSRHGRSRQ